MKEFNLSEWLQDKSRKVTTRLGNREVRIICYDRKNDNNKPIITLMIDPDGNEYTTFHTKNGFVCETEKYIDKRDLFFADEEEELTELQKTIEEIGREYALKDLPKWKKATEDKEFDRRVLLLEDDKVVIATCVFKDEYYIELNDLRTLPKEE